MVTVLWLAVGWLLAWARDVSILVLWHWVRLGEAYTLLLPCRIWFDLVWFCCVWFGCDKRGRCPHQRKLRLPFVFCFPFRLFCFCFVGAVPRTPPLASEVVVMLTATVCRFFFNVLVAVTTHFGAWLAHGATLEACANAASQVLAATRYESANPVTTPPYTTRPVPASGILTWSGL